ncbi:MAG: hypothetical protein E6Q97_09005 [Desulfurellales bacterium]|nr:MAG: hypothetical protein E6Q97_09005 [Desulfurellales bacterium]
MSFAKFWSGVQSANPAMNDDDTKMTLSVSAFRKAMERAYNAGVADGETQKAESGRTGFENLFNSFRRFGKWNS